MEYKVNDIVFHVDVVGYGSERRVDRVRDGVAYSGFGHTGDFMAVDGDIVGRYEKRWWGWKRVLNNTKGE